MSEPCACNSRCTCGMCYKCENQRLREAVQEVVDTPFDDVLDEGHDNAVRNLAALLQEKGE